MIRGVTYRTKNLTEWNENHRGEIELDAFTRVYLGDPEITDRDRFAFALRELRKRGYDVEACPVDWTKPLMICSALVTRRRPTAGRAWRVWPRRRPVVRIWAGSPSACRRPGAAARRGYPSLAWPPGVGLLARPLWTAARSAADLLIAGNVDRLKTCPSADCGWVFLDTTKSGTRRWCAMWACGSRAKARSYYARRRSRRTSLTEMRNTPQPRPRALRSVWRSSVGPHASPSARTREQVPRR